MKFTPGTDTAAPVIYVTRDLERAIGMEATGNYFIIANNSPYGISFQQKYPDNIWLITHPEGGLYDTHELLQLPEVAKVISEESKKCAQLLVFKNTKKIEEIAHEKGWTLLNPSAELAEKIENKVTQIKTLGTEIEKYFPSHQIVLAKNISWNKEPFILQWAHSHTGDGTFLITTEAQLNEIKKKFPEREARVTQYIKGPMFTSNIAIDEKNIALGNVSYQITGMLPFTENQFSTIGNDWGAALSILSEQKLEEYKGLAEDVAKAMQKAGWRGLFGIDVIYDEERDALHLIEINARQPASTSFESILQLLNRNQKVAGSTIFESHLAALQGKPITSTIELNDGAQIVQRLTHKIITSDAVPSAEPLREAGYTVLEYELTNPNSDVLRIQSTRSIMEAHNKLNERGKEILALLTPEN